MYKRVLNVFVLISVIFYTILCFAQQREVKVINVNYQKADSLLKVLDPIKSSKGKISVYSEANTIILNDYPEKIVQMEEVIKKLDVQKKRISITITVVEADDDIFRAGGSVFSSAIISTEEFDRFIYLVEMDRASKIRSQSSVTVLSGKKAILRIVDELIIGGYFTQKKFSDVYYEPDEISAGIALEVLPEAGKDNSIRLSIRPEMSDMKNNMTKHERSISTRIFLKNGETFLLGGAGIFRKDFLKTGTPLIDINFPVGQYKNDKNLLFFITAENLG